ncbi:MAG: hypothetical protein ACE5GT_00220, partial [Rhodospirillales bacterium]
MGDETITHLRIRLLAAVAAPLVLAGCGMPLGVQIASLFADGVSLLTTEKTLTDHGLSVVAGEDCAVWRSLEGEEICREGEAEAVADAGISPVARSFAEVPGDADVLAFAGPAPQGPSERPPEQPAPAQPADMVVTAAIERPPVQRWSP